MASFNEFLKGTQTKKPVSTGSFSSFLKTPTKENPKQSSKQEQAKANVAADPSNHVFNPLNPASKELNTQLDQRAPSTSVAKNFLPALGGAFKTAGKTALELPKGIVEPYIRPSETEKKLEAQMPNKGLGKVASTIAKPIFRTFEPIVESLGTQVGTAIGSKGKELPTPNDAFIAGGAFGLGAAGSFVGGEKAGGNKVPYQEKTPFVKSSEPILFKDTNIAPKVTSATKELKAPQTPQNAPGEAISSKPSIPTKTKELTYKPIEEKPLQPPEIKTSKLAQGVEEKAIKKKLTDGFGGLPEYAKVNVADQAKAATGLLKTNREQAINIAMGHELPPEGILPESVFVAVENHALKTKDVALLRDLATSSNLPSEATGMGQRIRLLAERMKDSPVSKIRDVVKAREVAAERRYGKNAKINTIESIKTEIKKAAPKIRDWSDFVESIKCR